MSPPTALIAGAGPAGLMAAQVLAEAGHPVEIFDAMPSPARKFLRAGIGGLNLTHAEPFDAVLGRYGAGASLLEPFLRTFGPDQVRQWAAELGIATMVGSSGRVFPTDFKAAPLLRAWLGHLGRLGVRLYARHRWLGWSRDGRHRFATPDGEILRPAAAAVLALGGASWPRLGSDGGWQAAFAPTALAPFRPANCGFEIAWSEHFRQRFAGTPVKAVALECGRRRLRGEFVVTAHGIEGGAVYALSAALRDAIAQDGQAVLSLDLKPDWSVDRLAQALARPQGSRTLATHLHRVAGLSGVAAGLLREMLPPERRTDAAALKAVPLVLHAPRPLAEAISSAGGLRFAELDQTLMLKGRPGIFAAGEMLDWEAPTGGYLLTACLSTGRAAGQGAVHWLERARSACRSPAAD